MSKQVTWLDCTRSPGGWNSKLSGARISKSKNQLTITLSPELMKKTRLYVGDRVRIGFDDEFLYLVRTTDRGYKLSLSGGDKGKTEMALGTHSKACVKVTVENHETWKKSTSKLSELILDDINYTVVIPRNGSIK